MIANFSLIELSLILKLYYTGSLTELLAEDVSDYTTESINVAKILRARANIAKNGSVSAEDRTELESLFGSEAAEALDVLAQAKQIRRSAPSSLKNGVDANSEENVAATNEAQQPSTGNKRSKKDQYGQNGGDGQMLRDLALKWDPQRFANDATTAAHLATALIAIDELDAASSMLENHQLEPEPALLSVLILLLQGKRLAAEKIVSSTQNRDSDNVLGQIAEAWTLLEAGIASKYEQAFFIFDELASVTSSTQANTAAAVCKLKQGFTDIARAILDDADTKEGRDVDCEREADHLVALSIEGADTTDARAALVKRAPDHQLLVDSEAKSVEFDDLAAKFATKGATVA